MFNFAYLNRVQACLKNCTTALKIMTYKVVKAINVDTLWLKQDTTYFKLINMYFRDQ